MKDLKLYGVITVLGFVLLEFFYLAINMDLSGLNGILNLLPSPLIFVGFAYFCLIVGTILLTAGVYSFGRYYFKDSELFPIAAFSLTPIVCLAPLLYFLLQAEPVF